MNRANTWRKMGEAFCDSPIFGLYSWCACGSLHDMNVSCTYKCNDMGVTQATSLGAPWRVIWIGLYSWCACGSLHDEAFCDSRIFRHVWQWCSHFAVSHKTDRLWVTRFIPCVFSHVSPHSFIWATRLVHKRAVFRFVIWHIQMRHMSWNIQMTQLDVTDDPVEHDRWPSWMRRMSWHIQLCHLSYHALECATPQAPRLNVPHCHITQLSVQHWHIQGIRIHRRIQGVAVHTVCCSAYSVLQCIQGVAVHTVCCSAYSVLQCIQCVAVHTVCCSAYSVLQCIQCVAVRYITYTRHSNIWHIQGIRIYRTATHCTTCHAFECGRAVCCSAVYAVL